VTEKPDEETDEPMAAQIQAHEDYLVVARELNAAVADGDDEEARRLRREAATAKRRWHRLVREAQAAMRATRPRS
jgi:hypothetical protein